MINVLTMAGGQGGQVHGRVRVCGGVAGADHSVSPAVSGPQARGAQPGRGGPPRHLQLPLLLRLSRPQHRVLRTITEQSTNIHTTQYNCV